MPRAEPTYHNVGDLLPSLRELLSQDPLLLEAGPEELAERLRPYLGCAAEEYEIVQACEVLRVEEGRVVA
jgi:hypothetical protein